MANTVVLKRSSVQGKSPTTSDLALGELALNTTDGNLFFKRDVSGTQSILSVATLTGTQTLTNKTLQAAVLTGTLTAGNSTGTNGQILQSTGTGVQWVTRDVSTLDSLTDVVISSPTSDQVLKFNGSVWVNAEADTAVASAVFTPTPLNAAIVLTSPMVAIYPDCSNVDDAPR